ncbi:STAS domain-containing protein [Mycolicibacterium stellerae]|uniref:STAS domain-containing protein n=1 Tax=Mycolicibacterium stellerae TaxID=2358193 RepID=UPI000F0BA57F|nr:STAS domain-containing protein [Mycolicibacterium stellerae]
MTDIGTSRVFRIDPRALDLREENGRAVFSACHKRPSTLLVTVEGDVDATNGRALARYIEGRVAGSARLELDLRLVDFFGTAGFAALHNINVICCRYEVSWALRAGRQLRRLLAICDPDGSLPVEDSQSVLDEVAAGARDRPFLVGRNN